MAGPERSSSDRFALVVGPAAWRRAEHARAWIHRQRDRSRDRPIRAIADQLGALADLVRPLVATDGAEPCLFAVHRYTLETLALELARDELARRRMAFASRAARRAIVGRVVHASKGRLQRFAEVAETPGFCRVLLDTLEELRGAALEPHALEAIGREGAELALLLRAYGEALHGERLADRAELIRLALGSIRRGIADSAVLLYDLQLRAPLELQLVRELAAGATQLLATAPAGDPTSVEALRAALARHDATVSQLDHDVDAHAGSALERLQHQLFAPSVGEGSADGSVVIASAPTADRECVEIARRIHALGARGVPADRIGVLLREARPYGALLEETFARAGLEIYPSEGAFRPDPAGRAFLLLLRSKLEGLPATRFSEYLSLGQVPPSVGRGAEPAGRRRAARDPHGADAEAEPETIDTPGRDAARQPVAPARWERLLGDAAVIGGGPARWRRRLRGLRSELQLQLGGLDDPDGARARALRRDQHDLERLEQFALPLLDELDRLPEQARWGEWIALLQPLARRALRSPRRVVELLDELNPLGRAGPVGLGRVVDALAWRLSELPRALPAHRQGRVFVGLAQEARGRSFDVVFVPGVAEHSFPLKVLQDPVLLDRSRRALSEAHRLQPLLATGATRRQRERLALHLAAGAARHAIVLSWPRVELETGRPRVPSFYLLEVARAVRGSLPPLDQLVSEAAAEGSERFDRPFPADAERAIDDREYDLSLLAEAERTRRRDPQAGLDGFAAHLHQHPFLVRALRSLWRRRGAKLSAHDGLMLDSELTASELLAGDRLRRRPYGVTSLERFAACPYRFYLHSVLRLRPLQNLEPEGHELIGPLTRGRLIHEVQARVLTGLRQAGLLPLDERRLEPALELLREQFQKTQGTMFDELAPPIEQLWAQEMDELHGELQSWLRREASDGRWEPLHCELAFGLHGRSRPPLIDPQSVDPPALVGDGIQLRGAMDLVERDRDGRLRVTDHKTGRAPSTAAVAGIGGGTSLQRVLYGLAYEALFSGAVVSEGRLYYCTERGGFRQLSQPLSPIVREQALAALETIDEAIAAGQLPALPQQDCSGCDYVRVCGRDAAQRARRKKADPRLAQLERLRAMR